MNPAKRNDRMSTEDPSSGRTRWGRQQPRKSRRRPLTGLTLARLALDGLFSAYVLHAPG